MVAAMVEQSPGPSDGSDMVATVADTRAELLRRSKRGFAPIAKSFVQNPDRKKKDRQGPLATFVRNADLRGLHAFLLLHAVISNGDSEQGWSTTLPLQTWARAFGISETAEVAAASTGASKVIRRLRDRRLVEKSSAPRREVRLTLLQPDGSGAPYARPSGQLGERFLKLSHDFWLKGWFQELDLAATAMLLVALHEKPVFELPTERMGEWYGFSPDTAERGFKTLQAKDILVCEKSPKKAPLSKTGMTWVNRYSLQAPFGGPQSGAMALQKSLLGIGAEK